MTLRVDLNCDLGEGGACDEELLGGITSANFLKSGRGPI